MKKKMNSHRKVHDGINEKDFISKMPDDVLLRILSRLPIKHVVVTSGLSTRWRFLWRNLIELKFDYTAGTSETIDKTANGEKLSERNKYINQVNKVIHGYNNPKVQRFQICFDLDNTSSEHINEWVQFALDKKVEIFELRLLAEGDVIRVDPAENYVLPSSIAMVGEMLYLDKLLLSGVNMNVSTLNGILKNSPHLTDIYMYGVSLFPHIAIGRNNAKLKHLTLVYCSGIKSISLYGVDLVSFTYNGPEVKFDLTDLPKLKELDLGEVSVGLENNVFRQISSCALYLQVLILDMWSQKKGLNVNAIIKLPNVKKLLLIIEAEKDDSLLEFTSIAQACPRLETFAISLVVELDQYGPIKIRKEVRRVATPHRHEHLKLLEIFGYHGRISDLELAVYVIENAVALKKIVIDPSFHLCVGSLNEEELKREKDARSSAKRQLTPILPPGVDLDIKRGVDLDIKRVVRTSVTVDWN